MSCCDLDLTIDLAFVVGTFQFAMSWCNVDLTFVDVL